MGVLLAGGLPGLLNQSSAQVIDGSLKFDKLTSHHLSRTPTSSNRKTWTWSSWIKNSVKIGNNPRIFTAGSGGTNTLEITILGSGEANELRVLGDVGGSRKLNWTTDRQLRDTGWFHITVALDTTLSASSNRLKLYYNGVLQGSGAASTYPSLNDVFEVNNNSVHYIGKSGPYTEYFDGSMSQCYFIDGLALGPDSFGFTDPLTNTWRPKKFKAEGTTVNNGTNWSSNFSGNGGTQPSNAFDGNGPRQNGYVHSGSELIVNFPAPGLTGRIIVYGGTGAGSHNSTTTDTFTLSDGSVLTSQEKYDVAPYFSTLDFGAKKNITSLTCSAGYTLYAVSVDGVVLKDSTTQNLDFGTNGFYLPMDNEDDFAVDKSGKGNNWTENGFIGTFNDPDVLKDSPSGAVSGGRAQTGITTTSSAPSNYATLNPININDMTGTTSVTVSDGNLSVANARNGYFGSALSTLSMTSGKYYCEATVDSNDDTTLACGILKIDPLEYRWGTSDEQIGYFTNGYGYRSNNGNKVNNNSNSSYGASYGNGNTIGIAFNLDAGTVTFYKDNVSQGVAYSSIPAGQYAFGFSCSETNNKWKVNFGQKPFKFPPPVGFQVLNVANVRPETVITRPDQYVGTVLYEGTGSAFNINYNFTPDFAWVKGRTFSSNHQISDTVRNRLVGGLRRLELPTGQAQDGGGPGFINSGLNINTGAAINTDDQNFVAWCWKAGGNKNTFNVDDVGYASAAAAGLTGAVNCTQEGASVGTKQGFSITVQEATSSSGATMQIPHGLTQKPDFIIGKDIDTASTNWGVYHASLGATKKIDLDQTGGSATNANYWDETEPTSSVIYTNAASFMYTSSSFVLYSWHNVPGLQKFGLYNGSGGGNGPFIELGFKPSILIIKRTDSSGDHWFIHDGVRNTGNPANRRLYPSWNQTEFSNVDALDLLSNGFKIKTGDTSWNADTGTYIYAAWAEAPTFNLYGGQSNAR